MAQDSSTKIGFMPGQMRDIAQDMNMGYGGGTGEWADYLRDMYSPSKIPQYHFGGGGGGGRGKGKGDGKGGNNDPRGTGANPDVFDPSSPRHRMAQMEQSPMTFPLGFQSGMPMQQQQSAMGQPQQGGQQLTPEMVNLLRTYMMRVQNVR